MSIGDKKWEVYTLTDPRTLRARYVGVTTNARARLNDHARKASRGGSHVRHWLASLAKSGLKPIYLAIEYGKGDGWQERERFWIKEHRRFCNLTNLTDGGEGAPGCKHSDETRHKMSKRNKGRAISSETRQKLRLASKSIPINPKAIEAMRLSVTGKMKSPEHRLKISQSLTGRKMSDEFRDTMRRVRTGWVHTEETRRRMSESWNRNRDERIAAVVGRKASPETRAKMVEAWKLRKARKLLEENTLCESF